MGKNLAFAPNLWGSGTLCFEERRVRSALLSRGRRPTMSRFNNPLAPLSPDSDAGPTVD